MLVLSRKAGQKIIINEKITITVVRVAQGSVRIGVDAPDDCTIVREEILDGPDNQNLQRDGDRSVSESDYAHTD